MLSLVRSASLPRSARQVFVAGPDSLQKQRTRSSFLSSPTASRKSSFGSTVTLYSKFTRTPVLQRPSLKSSATTFGEGWPIWATLAAASGLAQGLQRTKVGRLISAPLLAILLGLLLAAAGVVPVDSLAYNTVSTYLLPLAAALYLLESDVRELASTAKDAVLAFLLASGGTVIGTLIAWEVFGHLLGPEGYKVVSALAASYIGGSVNFAAVSSGLGMASGKLVAAAMSADMLAMAGYLAIISSWPVEEDLTSPETDNPFHNGQDGSAGATSESLSLSLAAASLACAAGDTLAAFLGATSFSLGIIAFVATCLSSLGIALNKQFGDARGSASPFQGSEALGGALMLLFFVTIGAGAGSISALLGTGWLTAFIAVQLLVHLGITVGIGRLLGLPMQALLTASNAAIGGPGTAVAMATSRNWTGMVRPALVLGAFGYSIGTPIGIGLARFLHS